MVWPLPYALNHDPSLFPDPDNFRPERFLPATPADSSNSLAALTTFPPTAFRPFEHGPRNCIGQDLALLEIKIVLVLTLRAFDVRAVYEEFYADAARASVSAGKTSAEAQRAGKEKEEKERKERKDGEKVGELGKVGKVGQVRGMVVPQVEGEKAYQILAATAKPKAGLPARVVRTERGRVRPVA